MKGFTTLAATGILLSLGCGRAPATAPDAPPTLDVTNWTAQTELFMEYPPLVAGQTAIFAVHLTRLSDFSAMTAGRPRVEMTPESGGVPVVLQGQEPSRPGVFRVQASLPPPGRYRWALVVDAPGLSDRHDLGAVTVFADQATAIAGAEGAGGEDTIAVSYLKEPQWTNGFATVVAGDGNLRRAIRVPAVIEPLTGGDALVAAPADGRFTAKELLRLGTRVEAGQELGRIEPRLSESGADRATLAAAVAEAQTTFEGARAELARAERLVAERAVPARRVEDARRSVSIAEVRLAAARARLTQRDEALGTGGGAASGNAFVIRAPIAGRVAEIAAVLGAAYDEGAPLFRIVRTDRVELQAHLPPADTPLADDITEIGVEIPGRAEPVVVKAEDMHDAGVIDAATHALPVQFDVDNRAGLLLIGQRATAILYSSVTQRMVTVPKEAILTDAGRPYVFVQTGGESFTRRFVEIGGRDRDLVGLRRGVTPGERVVTRGAYDVQLASAASGLPAEGHVH